MNASRPIVRRVAVLLARHAANMLPPNRSSWARAIANEIEHVPNDPAALNWAIGCVFASYRERLHAMNTGTSNVSRWVLSLEMLICFVPVTFFCIAVTAVAMSGTMPLRDALLYLSLAAIGPIGLIVAFRMVVLQRIELSGFALVALCVPAAWTALTFFVSILGAVDPIDGWRELVLIALLPLLGSAHLVFIARRSAARLLPG